MRITKDKYWIRMAWAKSGGFEMEQAAAKAKALKTSMPKVVARIIERPRP